MPRKVDPNVPKRPPGRPRKNPEPAAPPPAAAAPELSAEDREMQTEIFLNGLHDAQPEGGRRTKLVNDEATRRQIHELAKIFCTQEEIAGILGVSASTLDRFLSANTDAHDLWHDGIQKARMSLRRKQFKLAEKNAPAAIFLGKNYLGQKDEHTNVNVTKPVGEMSDAEILEILKRQGSTQAADDADAGGRPN